MTIEIPDKALMKSLEIVINPPSVKKRTVNEKTLSTVRYLNLNSAGIGNLEGIQWCKNVEVLYLADNSFQNISPLLGLEKVRCLDLSMNENINWELVTKPFSSVEQLFLRSCQIKNDQILRAFPNIRQVTLFHNELDHINYLYHLKSLEAADLLHNPIPVEELQCFYNQTGIGIMMKLDPAWIMS